VTTRQPILAQPDQRYWRAKANRRVRKARFTRRLLRWAVIVLVNALFVGALGYVGLRVARQLAHSGEFALEHVELEGLDRASEATIRAGLRPLAGQNLFELDLARVEQAVRADPWVLHASVRRVLPRTLRITVTERTPAALAVIRGRAHLVDVTGHVIGPAGAELADNLPVLTGLEGLEKKELIEALRSGVRQLDRLDRSAGAFTAAISELDLSDPDRPVVRTIEPGPRLLLDPSRVERNVTRYLALRAMIERRVGPIEYVDLRWRDRIAVMPAMESGEGR
jgi:cell division septal protein FtsQ